MQAAGWKRGSLGGILATFTAMIPASCQIKHVVVTKKQNPARPTQQKASYLSETGGFPCFHQLSSHQCICLVMACSLWKAYSVCVIGWAAVLYNSHGHTCNNAYSTKKKNLPKLYSIILYSPKGDGYVTWGSARLSFHQSNSEPDSFLPSRISF